MPIADWLFGKGKRNLDAKEAQAKEPMRVFDYMLYFNIPLVFALLGWSLWNFTTIEYDAFEKMGLVLSMGVLLATNAINVAHELGHRKGLFERTLSKLLYMPCLYMHFYIEHNFGHHLNVATKKDGASAEYNQNLYFFWIRSVTKQYTDAWKKQKELLKTSNSRFFSFKNDMLWYTIIQPLYLIAIYYTFSYKTMVFATAIGVVSFLFLETINYIE
ncbi:fatty acid desaturase, partial [Flavobacteriaceae bacterium]|nr:fatty acid desaturase [Flavobacteriaceae bacterium]